MTSFGELDLHLIGEGRHERLWERLGAHVLDGEDGVRFAVWAPNARGVSVVGDWNVWSEGADPLEPQGSSGVWSGVAENAREGHAYKLAVRGADGVVRLKADPVAFRAEAPPGTASIVYRSTFEWSDDDWLARRESTDPLVAPLSVYEVHAASWRQGLGWRDLADELGEHVEALGFTHVELLPVMQHPFGGSWGYQVTGFYAPQATLGTPDDFRAFVDALHARGIGVLLDWVPAHFPRDDWALARFDGTALYEHADPRIPTGARSSSTSAGTRCGTSFSRVRCTGSRSSTPTGCASTRSRRCSTSTTRASRANGCRTASGAARISRRSPSSRS